MNVTPPGSYVRPPKAFGRFIPYPVSPETLARALLNMKKAPTLKEEAGRLGGRGGLGHGQPHHSVSSLLRAPQLVPHGSMEIRQGFSHCCQGTPEEAWLHRTTSVGPGQTGPQLDHRFREGEAKEHMVPCTNKAIEI